MPEQRNAQDIADIEKIVNELDKEKFLDYLARRGGSLRCEVCESTQWSIITGDQSNESIINIRLKNVKKDELNRLELPSVLAMCKNCANTKMFLKHSIALQILLEQRGRTDG